MMLFEERLRGVLTARPALEVLAEEALIVESILMEKKHRFSSTQFNIKGDLKKRILAFGRAIPAGMLSDDGGWEDEPHVTVKFGIHSNRMGKLKEALRGFGEFEVTLGKTSRFRAKDKDVLKIAVTGRRLHDLNKLIADTVECTDTYPVYQPHVTIACMQPGTARDWVGRDDFDGEKIRVSEVVFSNKTRRHTPISLRAPSLETAKKRDD